MSLPDYVVSEVEDRARTRYTTPSNISPWAHGVSQMAGLTPRQSAELRRRGIDPATVDWMWVTVPITDPFEYDTRRYGRAVQRLACPIVRTVGDRIQVLTPLAYLKTVYAGGRLSDPNKKRSFKGFMSRG